MEDSQTSQSENSAKLKLQRYPLRSGTKSKDNPMASSEFSSSTASKRVRKVSSVSQSVSVLDLSGKEKSSKPPRRLSIPAKSASRPPRSNISPISEVRAKKRADSSQRKAETPVSDISKTSTRKKFCVLSSSSYWLTQIKLSESASKHSISLGFFKLAFEANCEPLQKLRDELTSYTSRYNLEGLGEIVKELLESYNIDAENSGQLQVSETCSQVPEEETRSSDEETRSLSSTASVGKKLRPKTASITKPESSRVTPVTGSAKKSVSQRANASTTKARVSLTKNSVNSRPLPRTGDNKSSIKKPQKPIKQEVSKEKDLIKKRGKKSAAEEGSVTSSGEDNALQENKENMDASSREEISLTEAM